MATSDEITKEKQRLGEAPAQLRGLQRLWMELRRAEAALADRLPCGPMR